MVELDFTSDSCAVLVWMPESEAMEMGFSVAGVRIEDAGGGDHYAMVGAAWDDARSDAENDAESDHCRKAVIAEIRAAQLRWREI